MQGFVKATLVVLALLVYSPNSFGQGYQSNTDADRDALVKTLEVSGGEGAAFNFKAAAKANNIASRKVSAFKELYNGYYLVAGVFGEEKNASRFIKALRSDGLDPQKALHPENNLWYIYLAYHPKGEKAIGAAVSGLDGAYPKKLWIMEVVASRPIPVVAVEKAPLPLKTEPETNHHEAFKQAARNHKIATRTVNNIADVNRGYYLIAGVFGDKLNAVKLQRQLVSKVKTAGLFYNPTKNSHYVYLGHFPRWEDAIAQGASGLQGRYNRDLWILEVTTDAHKSEEGGVTSGNAMVKYQRNPAQDVLKIKDLLPGTSTQKPAKDPPSVAKLIEKADSYFEKMWYAEAADLYEAAIAKSEAPGFDIIRKAGDSHYFNTNMERAYYWYDQLFANYKDEMSSENLFKYAHSLKGTGRYGRAKRLMRLYDRKVKTEDSSIPSLDQLDANREVLMDNILNTEQQMEIRNLDINSKYSDFAPMYYGGDKVVFASAVDSAFFSTRRYKWNNQPFLDLYVAKINEESDEIKDAVKFSKKVNTKYHEAGVTFSPDNSTMYFTRNNYGKKLKRDKNGINHLKIYQSTKIDGEWTEAVELPFNSDTYSTGHPALSPDGKQLYFVSDMPGSIGDTDIFVVDIMEDGSFSEPRNLGPEINTPKKEMFPFINAEKLYFSSNGHLGLGGLDIFEVAFDGTDGFLEVRNLGMPINSKNDDFSYIVNEASQKGYFASNRRGGKGDDDIYSFRKPVLEEVNHNAIAGVITELVTGDVIPEALVVLLDENNRKLKEVVTGADGSFVFEDLEGSTKYSLRTLKDKYEATEQLVSTLDNQTVEANVAMQRLEDRIIVENGIKKLKMDMIYFDFDKSYIRPDAGVELDKLVIVMNEYPDMVIRIESHTDSRGPAVYNKYLSDKRAKSTRDYLIKQGISAGRIESAVGYGEEQLLNECNGRVRCSEAKHQLNRRSEFIIVKM